MTFCLATSAAAQPGPGSRLLVLPFVVHVDASASANAGAAPYWLGEASAILLSDNLQAAGLSVLTRTDRILAFERLQLPLSATLTHATMIRVGDIVGASEVVVGDVELGAHVVVRARVIRLATGQQLREVSDEAPMDDIFALFTRLAGAVGGEVGHPAPGTFKGAPHPSLEAFENYVKGLVAATPAAQVRFLTTAVRLAPTFDRAELALWNAETTSGAYDKALAAAKAVLPTSPLARPARFSAALSLIDLKRYDDAFNTLDAIDKERASPVLSNALGVVQIRRGASPQTGLPVYYFNRATTSDPENADFLFNLGYAYALAHDPNGAIYWLREAVRVDPANGDAHLILSAVLTTQGKTVEAGREFDLAKLLGASHLGDATAATDKVPRGLERLRTDLDVPPAERFDAALRDAAQRDQVAQAAFYLERGRRLFDEENDREAIDELRRSVYLSPYQEEPHVLLGKLYMRAGRAALAVDEFKLAIWTHETVDTLIALGDALLANGLRDAARAAAARALVLKPDSPEATALMKRIGGLETPQHRANIWPLR